MTLGKKEVCEALYTRGDTNWLNVVVLGHGLGWVETHHIGEREQKQLVEPEWLGLILNNLRTFYNKSTSRSRGRMVEDAHDVRFQAFLSVISHRVRSLQLRDVEDVEIFYTVFNNCNDLEHLDLQGNVLDIPQRSTLFRFLRSFLAYTCARST